MRNSIGAHVCISDTNIALIELLDLGALERITSVDIALRFNELPRITVEQFCGDIQPTATRFRLSAEPVQAEPIQPPLDLDALQAEAQQRLDKAIDRAALLVYLQLEQQSINYTKRRGLPC